MMAALKDQVVIVTGGAHGIGKAYCDGFADAGACVVIADIDAAAAGDAAAAIEKNSPDKALAIRVDVSNEEATQRMAGQTL